MLASRPTMANKYLNCKRGIPISRTIEVVLGRLSIWLQSYVNILEYPEVVSIAYRETKCG